MKIVVLLGVVAVINKPLTYVLDTNSKTVNKFTDTVLVHNKDLSNALTSSAKSTKGLQSLLTEIEEKEKIIKQAKIMEGEDKCLR